MTSELQVVSQRGCAAIFGLLVVALLMAFAARFGWELAGHLIGVS